MNDDILYCPKCGSRSVESVEEAMKNTWMYHTHYCQECGCSFKVLRKGKGLPRYERAKRRIRASPRKRKVADRQQNKLAPLFLLRK